jgi:hypothetical protein
MEDDNWQDKQGFAKLKAIISKYPAWIIYLCLGLGLYGIYHDLYLLEPKYMIECRWMNSTTEVITVTPNDTEVCDWLISWDEHERPHLYKYINTTIIIK